MRNKISILVCVTIILTMMVTLLCQKSSYAQDDGNIRIITSLPATSQNIKRLSNDAANSVNNSQYACFVLYNLNNKTAMEQDNPNQAKTQLSPVATFDIALAAMGYNENILVGQAGPIWAYKETFNCNTDSGRDKQTPKTWVQNSVTWYGQQLATMVGMNNFKNYVYSFDYGNKDVSAFSYDSASTNTYNNNSATTNIFFPGLTDSWLGSTLKVSAVEQISFIGKLCSNTLPIKKDASEATKQLFFLEKTAKGKLLYGKAGTLIMDQQNGGSTELGWFVGWIESSGQIYVFAANRYYFVRDSEEPAGEKVADEVKSYLLSKGLL